MSDLKQPHRLEAVRVRRGVCDRFPACGFYPFPLFAMKAPKAAQGLSIADLAYSRIKPKRQERLPGPLYDAAWLAMFVVLGIATLLA